MDCCTCDCGNYNCDYTCSYKKSVCDTDSEKDSCAQSCEKGRDGRYCRDCPNKFKKPCCKEKEPVDKPCESNCVTIINLYTVLSNIKYTTSPYGASSIDDILDKDGRPSPPILTPQRGVLNISGYGTNLHVNTN